MVSIVVQNLVEIDAVVSITWNFQYFARLAWKCLFMPKKWGFGGISPPKWEAMSTKPPKGTSLRESTSFEPSSVKIRRRVWPVGEFMKKIRYISPICPETPRGRICTKFVTAVEAADIITCTNFSGDRSRGVDSVGVETCHLPLTKPVAVNTGLALPRRPWSVKRLHRYGDLTVLKMAAVRHFGFVKFEIFNGQSS